MLTTGHCESSEGDSIQSEMLLHRLLKLTQISKLEKLRLIQPQPTLAAARAGKVFAVTELLENILIHLPVTTILTSQRVCRHFKYVVKESVTIQEKLFLRVHGKGTQTWKIYPKGGIWALTKDSPDFVSGVKIPVDKLTTNYVVARSYNELFDVDHELQHTRMAKETGSMTVQMTPNDSRCLIMRAGTHLRFAMWNTLQGQPVPRSLMKMHLTDTTATSLRVSVDWKIDDYWCRTVVELQGYTSGCTIGRVLEAFRDTVPSKVKTFRRLTIPETATTWNIVKRSRKGAIVQILGAEFVLPGMLLPDEADRKACLPLPGDSDLVGR